MKAGTNRALERRFGATIGRFIGRGDPGIALAIERGDRLIFGACTGLADVEARREIGERTIFRLASITKTFCAALTLLLVDDGVAALDDPVDKHLPELHPFEPVVRIRHLLTMTSGLREEWELTALAVGYEGPWDWTRPQTLGLILAQTTQNFPAGSEQLYCNSNYSLLQLLIERATGESLAELLHERIFGPLGMTDSALIPEYALAGKDVAQPYVLRAGRFVRAPHYAELGAQGGVVSSLRDLRKWSRAVRRDRLGFGRILERLAQPVVLSDGTAVGYAYGIGRHSYAGRTVIGHSGGLPGMATEWFRLPDDDLTITFLANRNDTNWFERVREVALAALDPDAEPPTRRIEADAEVFWSEEYGDVDSGRALRVERIAGGLRCDGRVFYERRSGLHFAKENSGESLELPAPESPDAVTYLAGGRRYVLRRRSVGELDVERLREYEGTFVNDELPGAHRFSIVDGALLVLAGQPFPAGTPQRLLPVHPDFFRVVDPQSGAPIDKTFAFVRDPGGTIVGLEITQSLVWRYPLRKTVAPAPPSYLALTLALKGEN